MCIYGEAKVTRCQNCDSADTKHEPAKFALCSMGLAEEAGTTDQSYPMQLSHNRARSSPDMDCFPRLVWHPHRCIQISQGSSVQTDNIFSPPAQCIEAPNKAIRWIFIIIRSFHDLSKSAYIHSYGAFIVRPHIEYFTLACSPNLVADINHLEQFKG